MTTVEVDARAVRRHRVARLGLAGDRSSSRAVLDLGVQDTGPDGAAWALAVRGDAVAGDGARGDGVPDKDLVMLWTLRGAPHVYRRQDLSGVRAAVAPLSEADASKRVFDASRPLRAAGIPVLEALHTMATTMREIVTVPTPKGELSTALTERLPEAYVRWCRVCEATHPYEQTFRLATTYAGLELEPGTSPPVLRRSPGRATVGPADPLTAPVALQPVRAYLRLHGPATPQEVAAYVDGAVRDVKRVWPEDVVPVQVDGEERWVLADDVDALRDPPQTSGTVLLGPFDPLLQGKDRETLVPDAAHRKDLWRTLGRPGGVLHDGELVGSWRPRARGKRLAVAFTPWGSSSASVRRGVEEQVERLAAFRGVEPAGLVDA